MGRQIEKRKKVSDNNCFCKENVKNKLARKRRNENLVVDQKSEKKHKKLEVESDFEQKRL